MNYSLPGNPYAEQFDKRVTGEDAEATLALAYEQRTANLIAYAAHMGRTSNHGAMSALEDQVELRIGVRGDA